MMLRKKKPPELAQGSQGGKGLFIHQIPGAIGQSATAKAMNRARREDKDARPNRQGRFIRNF
jgi:hypothetical protein